VGSGELRSWPRQPHPLHWGGNGPDDPCTREMKYTVIDGNGARWSSCEAHRTAYRNSLR